MCRGIRNLAIAYSLIILGVISLSILVSKGNDFWHKYSEVSQNYRQMQSYLKTDVCRDPVHRSTTAKINKCDEYARNLELWPAYQAFYLLMEDMNICSNGRCVTGAFDVTRTLFHGIWWSLVVSTILILVGGTLCRTGMQQQHLNTMNLPSNYVMPVPSGQYTQLAHQPHQQQIQWEATVPVRRQMRDRIL